MSLQQTISIILINGSMFVLMVAEHLFVGKKTASENIAYVAILLGAQAVIFGIAYVVENRKQLLARFN